MKQPLIGKEVAITQCTHEPLTGTHGTVTDETKHTIDIHTGDTTKTILKHTATLTTNNTTIQGKNIQRRPEDCLK